MTLFGKSGIIKKYLMRLYVIKRKGSYFEENSLFSKQKKDRREKNKMEENVKKTRKKTTQVSKEKIQKEKKTTGFKPRKRRINY